MSLQLIEKRDIGDKFNKPPDIRPAMRPCFIEILCLGVRNMKPHGTKGMDSIREPFTRMIIPMANEDQPRKFETMPSRKPRGRDANFLDRQILSIDLPENAVYAPMIDIKVRIRSERAPSRRASCSHVLVSLIGVRHTRRWAKQAVDRGVLHPSRLQNPVEFGGACRNLSQNSRGRGELKHGGHPRRVT